MYVSGHDIQINLFGPLQVLKLFKQNLRSQKCRNHE